MNIGEYCPSQCIILHSHARAIWYTARDNIHQYSCNNPILFQILDLYECFVDRCLSFCPCSFGHCVVCSSSIYGFWIPLRYLQTLLKRKKKFAYLSTQVLHPWVMFEQTNIVIRVALSYLNSLSIDF